MKNKITYAGLVLLTIFSIVSGFILIGEPNGSRGNTTDNQTITQNPTPYVSPYGTVIYVDSMNGANDTNALKARGYKPYYRGTGPQGTTATWFQGNSSVFPAFNGPPTGYVAANYNVVTGANNIDSWLVFPRLVGGIQTGDSLYFYQRSPTGSTWPDSIRVMYSANDSVPEGSWTELGRFKTDLTDWTLKGFRAPTTSTNGRFAIRYCVVNGGPSGNNSDYIGIDAISIVRTSTGPTIQDPTNVCNYGTIPLYSSGVWGHASDWLGDTLYICGGSSAGSGSTTMQRYHYNSNTWSAGVALPESKAGHTLTKCGNALYLIGGSASVSTGGTTCWKYTPSTGAWVSIAPLPVALSGHNAVNWGDSVIFVLAGGWTSYSTGVYAYRPASNTWITSTSLPAGTGRRSAACGIWNGKIYLSCGYSGTFRNDLQIGTIGANASTITWAAGPNVPFLGGKTGSSRPGGTAVNNRFYLITGEVTPAPTSHDTIYIFNTQTNAWLTTYLTGRGAGTASNYWACVSNIILPNGKIKIFIPGGALSTAFPGLYQIQVDPCTITNISVNPEIPKDYNLSQNYPNPFNPTTKITFALPKSGLVTLKVYDVLGREVSTLVNEVKNAGTYTVEFDASGLSSGIYFYKLESNGFTAVKKMMLMK